MDILITVDCGINARREGHLVAFDESNPLELEFDSMSARLEIGGQ